jgi:hypothetical protein
MELRSNCRHEQREIESLKSAQKMSQIIVAAELKKLTNSS